MLAAAAQLPSFRPGSPPAVREVAEESDHEPMAAGEIEEIAWFTAADSARCARDPADHYSARRGGPPGVIRIYPRFGMIVATDETRPVEPPHRRIKAKIRLLQHPRSPKKGGRPQRASPPAFCGVWSVWLDAGKGLGLRVNLWAGGYVGLPGQRGEHGER
jgi:hypothetical protein